MELKPGYKRTEVGVIPEEWEIKQIADIAKVGSGGTPSRENPRYWDGDIPWVTTAQLDFKVIHEADQRITEEGLANSAARLLPPGTILMAMYGQGKTRGKVGILGIEAATNQACASIDISGDMLRDFVFRFLESRYDEIRNLSNSGSQENLSGQIVREIPVVCPPLPEQRAIATALSDADALLTQLDRLIAKKRDIKQAAMQQLLTGKTRPPGFGGAWVTRLLGEIASIRSGGTPSTFDARLWDGDIPWCTPTDITALGTRKYLSRTSRTITDLGLVTSSAELIPAGSIVMTSRATIGECAINTVPVTTNQGFKNFVPTNGVDAEFLYYLLQTQRSGFISLCGGSTFLEIGKGQLVRYEVVIPPTLAEQTAIATLLSDLDAELAALEARRAKTRALKQGMMQELLTGRTRLI